MKLLSQYGDTVHIPDEKISEEARSWMYPKTFLVDDNERLEECWIAQVCRENIGSRPHEYEFQGEEVYDHEPTEEELMFLMCKYDSLRFSYVTVQKGFRLFDPPD